MESPEQIWFLMSRCLSGEASVEEQQELQLALVQQPQLMQQYEMMTRLWSNNISTEHTINEDSKINRILQLSAVQDSFENNDVAIDEEHVYKRRRLRKRLVKYMAIAATIILPIAIFTFPKEEKKVQPNSPATEVVAQNGSRTRTILPDGSTVSLNAGSKIVYDENFNGTLREVTLFGEAFFDVVKNPDRPFIVHAGGINIRVLGTSFNVKSYPSDKKIETTLIHGLVQITNANDKKQQPIYLHPNQKFTASYFDKSDESDEDENERASNLDDKSFAIKNLDSTIKETERIETAWVYNRLEFKGDSFEELAKKMERWYNISISFEDDAVKKLQFYGSLEKETVEQAFTALRTATMFNFTIKGHEIFIKTSK